MMCVWREREREGGRGRGREGGREGEREREREAIIVCLWFPAKTPVFVHTAH